MLRIAVAISLLVAFMGCHAATKPTAVRRQFRDPQEVLRAGQITVDVMELAASPRFVELGERMKAAAAKNPAWMLQHVAQAKPGEPVSYDPKLGLSREEYDEFLALGKQMVARKKSEATVAITRSGEGVYVLDGGNALPDLTGIQIDLKKNLIQTPLGIANNRTEIHTDNQSPLGRWNGVQWQSDDGFITALTQGIVSLALGIVEDSGRGVLYYKARKLGFTEPTDIMLLLTFDLPKD